MIPDAQWLEALPDAMVVAGPDGRIVYANGRCTALLGWTAGELEGRPVEMLVPGRFAGHAARRERFHADPSVRPMGAGLELVARHKSGDEIAVDISLSPVQIGARRLVMAVLRDMRERREILHKLHLQSLALEAAASGVVITRRDGVIIWVNPEACRMTGYGAAELLGRSPSMLKSGQHDAAFYRELWETVLAGRIWKGAIINRGKLGDLYHEEQTIAPVRDPDGEITHFIAIKQDVTVRVRAEQALTAARDELARKVAEIEALHAQMRELALRDPLTGLHNRRYLDETLPRELSRAGRERRPLALLVFDIDHFKRINDAHGHATGDRVLTELAALLRARLRTPDISCRYGGEEFVVVLPGAELIDALRLAEELRGGFADRAVESAGTRIRGTFSAGVAAWQPAEAAHELIARADAALYRAKNAGRNRTVAAD